MGDCFVVKEIENIAAIVFFSETKGGRIWAWKVLEEILLKSRLSEHEKDALLVVCATRVGLTPSGVSRFIRSNLREVRINNPGLIQDAVLKSPAFVSELVPLWYLGLFSRCSKNEKLVDIFDQALTEEVLALQQGKKKVRDLSSLDCHAEVTPVGWPSREDILYEILTVEPCDSLSWVCAKVVNNPRLSLRKRKSVLQELLLQGHLQPHEYDAALNYEMD